MFREKVRSLSPGKHRVAIIDSIVSNPGVVLPWKEIVKICAEEGVLSIVDGAHSIGQELDINLAEVNPDFWVTVSYIYHCLSQLRAQTYRGIFSVSNVLTVEPPQMVIRQAKLWRNIHPRTVRKSL